MFIVIRPKNEREAELPIIFEGGKIKNSILFSRSYYDFRKTHHLDTISYLETVQKHIILLRMVFIFTASLKGP